MAAAGDLEKALIRSICALPLRTAHRQLGAITFGSKQVDAYSQTRFRFVSKWRITSR